MKTRPDIFLIAALALSGCAVPPAVLKSEGDFQLADDYYFSHKSGLATQASSLKGEIVARNDIPANDWPDVDQNLVSIGMNPVTVQASWGQPDEVHVYTSSSDQQVQWVYQPCDTCSMSFVYFENGAVSSIQN